MPNSLFLNDERVLRALQIIWHEAALLDRKDYPAWEGLFSDDAYYVIPIDPDTNDFENTLNLIYDDKRMRSLRVQRMIQGFAPSAVAAATTARVVSRFEVLSVSDLDVTVRSAQIITAHKRNQTDTVGAELTHSIRLSESIEGDRIALKVARLINSEDAIKASGYLI